MEELKQWDKELLELNRKIMDLRTELVILEGRKEDIFKKRKAKIDETQSKLLKLCDKQSGNNK